MSKLTKSGAPTNNVQLHLSKHKTSREVQITIVMLVETNSCYRLISIFTEDFVIFIKATFDDLN